MCTTRHVSKGTVNSTHLLILLFEIFLCGIVLLILYDLFYVDFLYVLVCVFSHMVDREDKF